MHRATRGEFIVTNGSTSNPVRLTSKNISSLSRVGDTRKCIVECPGHGLTTGCVAYIGGANEPEFNTTSLTDAFGVRGALVVEVLDTAEFVIMLDGTTSLATGSLSFYADIWVRQATLLGKKAAQTANAGSVYIGTIPGDGSQPYEIPSNGEAFLPAGREGVGPLINLADWYLDVTTADDGLYVLYF